MRKWVFTRTPKYNCIEPDLCSEPLGNEKNLRQPVLQQYRQNQKDSGCRFVKRASHYQGIVCSRSVGRALPSGPRLARRGSTPRHLATIAPADAAAAAAPTRSWQQLINRWPRAVTSRTADNNVLDRARSLAPNPYSMYSMMSFVPFHCLLLPFCRF